ncbi:MAG: ATP-dependent helicase [Polyangiaceae bacterium]
MASGDGDTPLNEAQAAACLHGDGPLLVIAGAGSGKTQTLAHRVAALVDRGVDPRRILLLTFTRRAAVEMIRRASRLTGRRGDLDATLPWAGTFHSVANRLLRQHAQVVELDPNFTLLDREDSADLMDAVRVDAGLAEQRRRRFPRKGTSLAIYSRVVNTQGSLRTCLETAFPWCLEWEEALRVMFAAYVEAKLSRHVLDYDDLLLYWYHLLGDQDAATAISGQFDHILVDEYQDTNVIQAGILRRLRPAGRGLCVVGDDAQSIYAFRAANVRNILDFPSQFSPPATVLTLAQNYRSTQPILAATNAVIGLAAERFTKDLFTMRPGGARPHFVTVGDEDAQASFVADAVLEKREAGVLLKQQAVLFRAAHHSDALEIELGRRNIPFVKFGGLRFLEAAHVKDTLACLRWAENPRDTLASSRVLQLLPGVGPVFARRVEQTVVSGPHSLAEAIARFVPPAAAADDWPALVGLVQSLTDPLTPWMGQLGRVRHFYEPHLERLYDNARTRLSDLDQIERLADAAPSRERFLSDLTLDPPESAGAQAGPPHLDEDFLILSTIHSAKGQEWDSVYVLSVADGCLPSDLATGRAEEIEEERRLLYVAMTRAKNTLCLIHPLRFFVRQQSRRGDRYVMTPRSRFLPASVLRHLDHVSPRQSRDEPTAPSVSSRVDMGFRLREQWK